MDRFTLFDHEAHALPLPAGRVEYQTGPFCSDRELGFVLFQFFHLLLVVFQFFVLALDLLLFPLQVGFLAQFSLLQPELRFLDLGL